MKTRSLRRTAKNLNGPGTPGGRFNSIMSELEKRYPDPTPLAGSPPEGRYMSMIDEQRLSTHTALQAAITALDDWLNLHAPEECHPARVLEAQKRVGEYGTIAYIANVVAQCRMALNRSSGNDQDSNEDR